MHPAGATIERTMVKIDFQQLDEKRARAAEAMRQALERKWPKGSTIYVLLNSRQHNATRGTVSGHRGTGEVTVALEKLNRRGYPPLKNVHWSRCLQPSSAS